MNDLLIAFLVFGLFFVFMSIGLIFKGKRIKGSCGGLGKLMGDECEFCDKKDECPEQKKKIA